MRTLTKALPLVGLIVSFGAGPALASDNYVIHQDVRMDDTRRPSPGKALIYFVRTQNLGGAISVQLVADRKPLGWTRRKTFIAYECDPGKHEFASISEGGALLDAEVLPGKIYYVQVAIHMGLGRARSHFEVIRAASEARDEFLKSRSDLRGITTTEEGLRWFEENRKEVEDTIARERKDKEEIAVLKPEDGYDAPLAK